MHDHIDEPIEVLVHFRGHHVRPTLVHWNGRQYPISTVNFVHASKIGDVRTFTFTASDIGNTNVFKLLFNTESLEWRLLEIFNEG